MKTHPLIQALQEVTKEAFPLALEELALAARHITKNRERELTAEPLKGKRKLLDAWFGEYVTPEVKNTLSLFAEEGKLAEIRKEMKKGEVEEIRVITAKKISEETKIWVEKELGKIAEGAPIVFREDPALLGGVKITAGDREVEYSLRQRLARI